MRKTVYNIDWTHFQKDYDSGIAIRFLLKKHQTSFQSVNKANKLKLIKLRTQSEAAILNHRVSPRELSEKTKQKISKSRKKYLQDNPDKVPYLLNHKHKRKFYSEEYFYDCLKGTNFTREYKVDAYSLDFADVNNKIDLEVDGDQHFLDEKIVQHDKKRNLYLSCLGWTVIRVKWSEFQKLKHDEKKNIIDSIKLLQNPMVKCVAFIRPNENPELVEYYTTLFKSRGKKSCNCGNLIDRKNKCCAECLFPCNLTKPELHWYIWNYPKKFLQNEKIIATKIMYKWIKKYQLNSPPQGFFLKNVIDYQI